MSCAQQSPDCSRILLLFNGHFEFTTIVQNPSILFELIVGQLHTQGLNQIQSRIKASA